MAEISETQLATSEPLDVTVGFPIFPLNNSLDNPSTTEAVGLGDGTVDSHTLFSTSFSLVLWSFSGSLTYIQQCGAFFGFALSYTVEGETKEDGTATLTISDDDTAGGAGFGCGISGEFNIALQSYHVQWVSDGWDSGFQGSWENLLNFEISIEADLIKLLLQFLKAAGFQVPLQELNDTKFALGFATVYGALADSANQFSSQGNLTLTPTVYISSDLAEAIPALEGVSKAIRKIGGELSFGPALGISFPITMVPARLITDNTTYEYESFQDGVFQFKTDQPSSDDTIDQVTVVTSHTVSVEFTLRIQGGIELWTIVDISSGITVDLTESLNLGLGPYYEALSNSNGGDVAETMSYQPLPEIVWG